MATTWWLKKKNDTSKKKDFFQVTTKCHSDYRLRKVQQKRNRTSTTATAYAKIKCMYLCDMQNIEWPSMYVNTKQHLSSNMFVCMYVRWNKSMQVPHVTTVRHGAKSEHKFCFRLWTTATEKFRMLKSVYGDKTSIHVFEGFPGFMTVGRTLPMT